MTNAGLQLANDVVSALANGLYQGLALAAVLWLAFKALRRTNASTRYAVGFLTLIAMAALPVGHFVLLRFAAQPSSDPAPIAILSSPSTVGSTAAAQLREPPPFQSEPGRSVRSATQRAPAAEAPASASATRSTAFPDLARPQWQPSIPAPLALGLSGAALAIVALLLARLAREYRLLRRMKRCGETPDDALAAAFESLRRRILPRRAVRLLLSDRLSTPLAAGLGAPTVLAPKSLQHATSPAQLEGILLHELAHIRRRDDWTNLIQQVIHAALFFYPGVWWLSRRLTVDREIACDDAVLALTRQPKTYALLLADFAGQRQNQHWTAAPAAWINSNQLKERIAMILDKSRNASPRLARRRAGGLAAGALALAAIATLLGPRLALAAAASGDAMPPVGSERKFKADRQDAEPRRAPAEPIAPAAPLDSGAAMPAPSPAPMPAPMPRPIERGERSADPRQERIELELRLAGLEQLVQSLVEARVGEVHADIDANFARDLEGQANIDARPPKIHFDWRADADDEHRFAFQFEKEAFERAMEQGAQAREQAMKSLRSGSDAQRQSQLARAPGAPLKDRLSFLAQQREALERQLDAIDSHRDTLHGQIDALEAQIEALEDEIGEIEEPEEDAEG